MGTSGTCNGKYVTLRRNTLANGNAGLIGKERILHLSLSNPASGRTMPSAARVHTRSRGRRWQLCPPAPKGARRADAVPHYRTKFTFPVTLSGLWKRRQRQRPQRQRGQRQRGPRHQPSMPFLRKPASLALLRLLPRIGIASPVSASSTVGADRRVQLRPAAPILGEARSSRFPRVPIGCMCWRRRKRRTTPTIGE